MTYVNKKLALRDKFLEIFRVASQERGKRGEFVAAPEEARMLKEPGWVAFERQAMLDAVNLERRVRGLPHVTVAQVIRVENQACGHVDYGSKFALYCAELAMGDDKPEP